MFFLNIEHWRGKLDTLKLDLICIFHASKFLLYVHEKAFNNLIDALVEVKQYICIYLNNIFSIINLSYLNNNLYYDLYSSCISL